MATGTVKIETNSDSVSYSAAVGKKIRSVLSNPFVKEQLSIPDQPTYEVSSRGGDYKAATQDTVLKAGDTLRISRKSGGKG